MDETFQLDILTPRRLIFSGTCEKLVAPGIIGEFGVLAGHANMLAELDAGVVRYRSQGKEHILVTDHGFVDVKGERVTVLLDQALRSDEIDVEDMKKRLKKAEETSYTPQDEQFDKWNRSVKWMRICLQMAGNKEVR